MPLILDVTLERDEKCQLWLEYDARQDKLVLYSVAQGRLIDVVWDAFGDQITAEHPHVTALSGLLLELRAGFPTAIGYRSPFQAWFVGRLQISVHQRLNTVEGGMLQAYWRPADAKDSHRLEWFDNITSTLTTIGHPPR